MYPYPIRLHGPWEVIAAAQLPRRVTMPALVPANGTVQLVRRFGLPKRIDVFERVWLCAENVRGACRWLLNGAALGEIENCPVEFEVTARLRERNEVVIEFSDAAGDVGFAGDIAIVIRCVAYLSDVHARRSGDRVTVSGFVAGECQEPLELYLLADNRPCGYGRVLAGETFELTSDRAVDEAAIRVELVNASTIWHSEEVRVES